MSNDEFDELMQKLLKNGMKKDKVQIERLKKKLQNNITNNSLRLNIAHERSTTTV